MAEASDKGAPAGEGLWSAPSESDGVSVERTPKADKGDESPTKSAAEGDLFASSETGNDPEDKGADGKSKGPPETVPYDLFQQKNTALRTAEGQLEELQKTNAKVVADLETAQAATEQALPDYAKHYNDFEKPEDAIAWDRSFLDAADEMSHPQTGDPEVRRALGKIRTLMDSKKGSKVTQPEKTEAKEPTKEPTKAPDAGKDEAKEPSWVEQQYATDRVTGILESNGVLDQFRKPIMTGALARIGTEKPTPAAVKKAVMAEIDELGWDQELLTGKKPATKTTRPPSSQDRGAADTSNASQREKDKGGGGKEPAEPKTPREATEQRRARQRVLATDLFNREGANA